MADLNLDDLAVFVRVVERGGFAGAAREIGAPTSTVSRAIGRLESRAGVRLFQRTTRHTQPTSEGRELYAAVAPSVSTLRAAAQALEPATRQPRGRLRVTAPPDLCAGFLADVVVAFAERHPHVQLDFALANRHANLVEDGFDVAVRATVDLADSSLVARKLGELELRLYALSGLPREARRARDVGRAGQSPHGRLLWGKELARTWELRGWAATRASRRLAAGSAGMTSPFVRSMIVAGAGIGLLPRINCAADEASGRLVRVLPDYHARGASLYVVVPSAKNVPARVTAFRDFVVAAFAPWRPGRDGQ